MTVSVAQAQLAVSVASVIFSGVLVAVTYMYWQETQNHTEEMRASREAEFKPVLKSTLVPWLSVHRRFVIENTGKGAAHDVTARWGFTHLDYEKEWKSHLISPGQRHMFYLPFDNPSEVSTGGQIESELENTDGVLYFEWEGTDALGNTVSNREEIDVLDAVKKGSGELLVESEEKKIRKELEDLNDSVSSIPSLLNRNLEDE